MKKLILILLAFSLAMFCSCETNSESENHADAAEVDSAAETVNSETRLSGNYMLEITFGESGLLYYALGDIAWDRAEEKVFAEFDQTYLGSSSKLKNYFSDGEMISIEGDSSITSERDPSELFSKFPYFKVPKTEGAITKGSNSSGDTFSFEIEDSRSLCDLIIGGDIYNLVTVLKKPQKDKTEYSAVKCIYTVKEGRMVSCRYEFDVKLFDTPAYIPGNSQPEEDYTITVHVTAKVGYEEFGESVEIAEKS